MYRIRSTANRRADQSANGFSSNGIVDKVPALILEFSSCESRKIIWFWLVFLSVRLVNQQLLFSPCELLDRQLSFQGMTAAGLFFLIDQFNGQTAPGVT